MSSPLSFHIVQLAERLSDLRRRLKEAARFEVAQAISETLGAATRALICGPPQFPSRVSEDVPSWDDPWADPFDDRAALDNESEFRRHSKTGGDHAPSRVSAALLTAFGAARWSFSRSGQPIPALALATLAATIVLVAGAKIAPFLDVFSVAQDLFLFTDRRR